MLELWNRHTQRLEPIELFGRIEAEDIACFEQRWLPPMQAKAEELKRAGQFNAQAFTDANVADVYWQWPSKFKDRTGQLQWASYSLRGAGLTQGLMYVNLVRRCRLPSQLNQHMIYVDLVSTAPWNRPRLTPNPVYGGVGGILLTEAIIRSLDEGFEGRVGLHSLPGAEPLYRKFEMECLGPDEDYDDLPYYELTPQRATQLLASRTP